MIDQRFKIKSRKSMIEWIKTMILVVPLTLGIWLYAEREQIADEPNIAFPIRVRSTNSNEVVKLISPSDQNVMVTLSGPRGKLQQIKNQLFGATSGPLIIDISPSGIGTEDHLAAPLLSAQPIFHDQGVTIKSCSPVNLQIQVDEMIVREARVVAPIDLSNLESVPVFDPPTVNLKGPRSILDEIGRRDARGTILITPDLTGIEAVHLPGTHELQNVPLVRPIKDSRVTVEPKTINVTLNVKQSSVEGTLPFVSIFPYAARSLLDEYKVQLPNGDTLPNVHIVGPRDLVDQLVKGTIAKKPTAMLPITRDDVATGGGRRVPEFVDFPRGIQVIDADKNREIEFKITRRGATE